MKRILITGENGFLGSNLFSRLSKSETVFGAGTSIETKKYWPMVDEIYNLAGTPSPAKYLKDPINSIETNTTGVINIMRHASILNSKVLHASTIEIIDPGCHLDPRACYRYGKIISETICSEYLKKGIDVKILRMSNSYGPGMSCDDGRVIPVFIMKALRNEKITIMGGKQTRSFCYVDDMIDGIIKMMSSNFHLVNIFSEERHSIIDIAEMIVSTCDSKSEIVKTDCRPQGDSDQKNPTDSTAYELLNWKPRVSFETGIKKTVDFFRTLISQKERRGGYVGKENQEDNFYACGQQLAATNN